MAWRIEFTDEFGAWWDGLSSDEQDSVDFAVRILEQEGPALTRPYADTVRESRFPNMRELRVQHEGRPYRIFYGSIRDVPVYFLSVETRQAMRDGTGSTYRKRTRSTRSICAK